MRSSIYDVAKRAGVSISTVSRVLNRSANVNEKKVKAVLEAVEFYNYKPNQFGRGLVKQTSNTIGVYFPYSSNYVFDNVYTLELLRGMAEVVADYDYSLLLINENDKYKYSENNNPKFEEHIIQKRIDGLLLTGIPENSLIKSSLIKLLARNYPVAYVGKRIHENGFNVYAQYERYMYQMIEGLYQNGHREILVFLLTGQSDMFKQVEKKTVSMWPDLKLTVNIITFEKHYKIKQTILNKIKEYVCEKNCTAICSGVIEQVTMILAACNELNLTVPEDVSIISVEHKLGDGQTVYPPVNSFYVPVYDMGVELTKMLLSKLNGEKDVNLSREFETPYIYRKSVKNIK